VRAVKRTRRARVASFAGLVAVLAMVLCGADQCATQRPCLPNAQNDPNAPCKHCHGAVMC